MTAAARKRTDLVLSGGGIKGVALVGAVGALIDASGLTMSRIRPHLRLAKVRLNICIR
jgi:predicted acylesterase/phospholipase RssA